MKRGTLLVLSLVLALMFSISLASSSFGEETKKTVTGNVICLIPDYEKGTVNPVIATGPCAGLPPHSHLLVTKDNVYVLQGLQEGLMKIQESPQKTNVTITGRVKQSPGGWVLYVE